MASIPSAIETSFDPEVSLLRFQSDRGNASRSRNGERPQDPSAKAESASGPQEQATGKITAPPNRAVTFRLDRESERFYIQVVDRNTGEVIRQIPPEGLLELAKSVGSLLNLSA